MSKSTGTILLVDDDELVLLSLSLLLEPHFTKVVTTDNPERIPTMVERETVNVVVLDMNFRKGDTSGNQGLFWLRKILGGNPETQVILLTAYADIHLAVESIREGALDFVVKPWENEKLLTTIKAANKLSQEQRKVKQLHSRQKSLVSAMGPPHEPLLGVSKSINDVRSLIARVAPTEADVLILGPNGAGKEIIAREIHRQSTRAGSVFLSVDVGSLTESLFESEMFGHLKGSFTDAREDRAGRFEAAAGGTLFLDEIGNLSLSLQSKLLTALQHKRIVRLGTHEPIDVDVRIICATNASLANMVRDGTFREDLYYRINTVEINVPPLNARPEDIPVIAEYFLKKLGMRYHREGIHLSDDAVSRLQDYPFPGNTRELHHVLERAVILSDPGTNVLTSDAFVSIERKNASYPSTDTLNLEKLEEWAIRKALAKHNGNVSHAAEELGLSRGALYRRLGHYGI